VKEQLRRLLRVDTTEQARAEKVALVRYVLAADMNETTRLWTTVCVWWPAIEVPVATGATNARTEAENTAIEQIKRTGHGYRTQVTTGPVFCSEAPPDARREPIDQAGHHGQTANSRSMGRGQVPSPNVPRTEQRSCALQRPFNEAGSDENGEQALP
jgi:hypothetical protein